MSWIARLYYRLQRWFKAVRLYLVLAGPGVVVMIADNDAGGITTYAATGAKYQYSLIWFLLLLIPVAYYVQEMTVRLGAVTKRGHAEAIFDGFGAFWGWFSLIDLIFVDWLTLVTEFVGMTAALAIFGVPAWMTVVGVVDDVRLRGLDEKPFPQIYLPYEQYHQDSFAGQMFLELAVRFSFDPAPMTAAVRAQIRGIDEDQPVTRVKLMKEAVEESAAAPKFQTLVCGLFAAIALPLAGVGVYGVLSYSVEQRRHEIGVRVALGAGRRQTLQLILGDGMMLAVFGSLAGLGAALAITPTLRSYLYGVQGMDAIACCTAALVLLVVAALSAYVPARRAARVDPVITLRHE